jgi:hypothetical protein
MVRRYAGDEPHEPSRPNYEDLPRDPEEAFLHLERQFRDECEERARSVAQDESPNIHYVHYMASVIAAIQELGLEAQFNKPLPTIGETTYDTYLDFGKDVRYYRTRLEIRHGRRVQGYSVKFDAATKDRLRHHLKQMRGLVDKAEVEWDKKEALFSKINALQEEIDRDRTRLDALADLTVTAAGILDTALEPINKILNNVARVFHGAQQEEQKRLPAPTPRKQIEGPKENPQGGKRGDMDDEIPF